MFLIKIIKQRQKIHLYDIPKNLIKFCWETLKTRWFVMFHLKHHLFYFCFSKWRNEATIFLPCYLRYIMDMTFHRTKIIFLWWSKQPLIIICEYVFNSASPTIIPSYWSNLKMCCFLWFPFATKWKYWVLSSPSRKASSFSSLIPFNFFFPQKLNQSCIEVMLQV